MIEPERRLQIRPRFDVVLVASVRLVQLGQHRLIGALEINQNKLHQSPNRMNYLKRKRRKFHLWKFRFFVDERHNVHLFDGDQIERVLVVDEFDMLPADVLRVVLFLLQLENVADEELLQVLVGVVDAKLLETVDVEVLEAENVQHSDGARVQLVRLADGAVELVDDPDEEPAVNAFGEGISHVDRLHFRQSRHLLRYIT